MKEEWLVQLLSYAEKKGCIILNFDDDLSEKISLSKNGFSEFTKTYPHGLLPNTTFPLVCFLSCKEPEYNNDILCIGILSSNAAISTLESRVKYKNGKKLFSQLDSILIMNKDKELEEKLLDKQAVVCMNPKLSKNFLELLSGFTENNGVLQYISDSLNVPRTYGNNKALQEDAVQTALKAFGVSSNEFASDVVLIEDKSTALIRLKQKERFVPQIFPPETESTNTINLEIRKPIPFIEDHAIAKDARSVPGYSLQLDELTGKALFEKDGKQLEIYTANRGALEQALGVDLIYINLTQNNVVMVQYKMLKRNENSKNQDWVYYPDENLEDELSRMKKFNINLGAIQNDEYRLNSTAFYLKFVKRDALLRNGSIILPIEHYQNILKSPKSRGVKNGVRISYNSLKGQYLRQGPFLGLIQSGYIGSYHKTTEGLKVIINSIIQGNRAVITAIQREIK